MWSAIAVRSASKPVPHTIFSALPPVDLGTATTTTPTWRDRSKLSQKHTTHANKHADLRLPDSPTPCKVTLPMLCHGPRCVAGDTHARARHCNPPFHAPSSVRLHVHGEPNNRHMVTVLPPPAGSPPRMARTWRAGASTDSNACTAQCQQALHAESSTLSAAAASSSVPTHVGGANHSAVASRLMANKPQPFETGASAVATAFATARQTSTGSARITTVLSVPSANLTTTALH